MTKTLEQKNKALAEHWIGRFMIEKNLKSREDIDPFEFSLWLQSREIPSNGQKRNIASAVKKHFGIKLLAICENSKKVNDKVAPSKETFNRTMENIIEFKKKSPVELHYYINLAINVFLCTSFTGLSISDLMRSEICSETKINKDSLDSNKEKYQFIIKVNPTDRHSCPDYSNNKQVCMTKFSSSSLQKFNYGLESIRDISKTKDIKKTISKIQYIITKNNEAKGYSLRKLRKIYPDILGGLKYER